VNPFLDTPGELPEAKPRGPLKVIQPQSQAVVITGIISKGTLVTTFYPYLQPTPSIVAFLATRSLRWLLRDIRSRNGAIVDSATNMKRQISPASRPVHLLRFIHPVVQQETGRPLGDRRSNPRSGPVARLRI
jgi:hypothetical protein